MTLIIFRSIYDIRFPSHVYVDQSGIFGFRSAGFSLATEPSSECPFSLLVTLAIAIVWHIVLSRMRPGWRLTAVGGARRSSYNAGIV